MTTEAIDPPPDPRRRALLYTGVAAAAAIAGAGVGIWKWRESGSRTVDASLWSASFEAPAGGPVTLQSFRGKPLLLNFWATWCPPCVEEMPLLDAFFRQNSSKQWQVLGLAIDQPSSVRKFLEKTPVSYPIGLAGFGGTELSKTLGNESGGLPFTIVISAAGDVAQRRIGRVTPADLAAWGRQT